MTDVLIMAAGLGTRMKSNRAKVLHEVAGTPLVAHVLRAAFDLKPESVFTVVGHQAELVEQAVRDEADRLTEREDAPGTELRFVHQKEQRGTGHAVLVARADLESRGGPLIIIAGDGPMIKGETLRHLVEKHTSEKNDATLLTVEMDDPTGYGRIIRDDRNRFLRSVEQKDATPDELAVREVNVSIYCFEIPALVAALDHLTTDNAQGEYYLTD
ncbi:MAG TPA: NTP transferase domain-containing protein, partial [Blastocatellia bacterium]|nr:NTP transferase domain-containing protein [Blastocatellia bacterium]